MRIKGKAIGKRHTACTSDDIAQGDPNQVPDHGTCGDVCTCPEALREEKEIGDGVFEAQQHEPRNRPEDGEYLARNRARREGQPDRQTHQRIAQRAAHEGLKRVKGGLAFGNANGQIGHGASGHT